MLPNGSEWRLAEHHENEVTDLLPTQGSNANYKDIDTDNSSEKQEKEKKSSKREVKEPKGES